MYLAFGDNAVKYESQSKLTFVVFSINFNFPATDFKSSESLESITLFAPIDKISFFLDGFELKGKYP